MPFLGKVVGVGKTSEGRDFGVFAYSEESPYSICRVPVYGWNEHGSFVEMRFPEEGDSDIGIYRPIQLAGNAFKDAIITSGPEIAELVIHGMKNYFADDALAIALVRAEHVEGDGIFDLVPNIGAISSGSRMDLLGIHTTTGTSVKYQDPPGRKGMQYMSTMTPCEHGDYSRPSKLKVPSGYIPDMDGETAQEIADNMFDWMDKNFVKSTAAVLHSDNGCSWELAATSEQPIVTV